MDRLYETLPQRFEAASLKGYGDELSGRYVAAFDASADGLVIGGANGTGKTHLAAALYNHLGGHAIWADVVNLLARLRSIRSYNETSPFDIVDRLGSIATPVFLDDITASRRSDVDRLTIF